MTTKAQRETAQRNRDRIALIERYIEDREAVQDSIYRLVQSATQLKFGHSEIERTVALLKPLEGCCWEADRELQRLKGEQ